jgi:hypothetical protein
MNVPKIAGSLMKIGGAATKEGVEGVMKSARNLGVDLPLAEVIKSRGIAKLQKIGLKNIPGSGMHQEYEKLNEGLTGQIRSLLNRLNPENQHSGEAVQDFLTDKYDKLKDQVGELYENIRGKVSESAPGNIHDNSSVFSEAEKIKDDFANKLKRPGGSVKVPMDVKTYIEQISKGKSGLGDAFLDDEIINANIGDSLANLRKGGKESKDAERALPYWFRLKNQNLKDIDSTVEGIGSKDISEDWSNAKKFYKEKLAPYTEQKSKLKEIITEPNIDNVQKKFLQVSGQQPKSELLRKVAEELPQEIKDKVAHAHLLGPGDRNLPGIIDSYKKLQPKQRGLMFSKEDQGV